MAKPLNICDTCGAKYRPTRANGWQHKCPPLMISRYSVVDIRAYIATMQDFACTDGDRIAAAYQLAGYLESLFAAKGAR